MRVASPSRENIQKKDFIGFSDLSTTFSFEGEVSNHKGVFDENSNARHIYSFFTLNNVLDIADFEIFQVSMIIK